MSLEDLSASSQAHDRGAGVRLGVRLGIHSARQAVKLAHDTAYSQEVNIANADKLDLAHCYLQLPSSVARSAKAYNLVMDVRNFSKNCSPQCEVLSKNAAMAIRDALVLQICCGVDSMSYVCVDKLTPIEDTPRITADHESDTPDKEEHGAE